MHFPECNHKVTGSSYKAVDGCEGLFIKIQYFFWLYYYGKLLLMSASINVTQFWQSLL